jgi:hypothetical protein
MIPAEPEAQVRSLTLQGQANAIAHAFDADVTNRRGVFVNASTMPV